MKYRKWCSPSSPPETPGREPVWDLGKEGGFGRREGFLEEETCGPEPMGGGGLGLSPCMLGLGPFVP